jgi:hypothetical protein
VVDSSPWSDDRNNWPVVCINRLHVRIHHQSKEEDTAKKILVPEGQAVPKAVVLNLM